MCDQESKQLTLAHFWLAFGAFGLAALMGVYQVVERSGLIPALKSPAGYFASVSTHGVLMGFVLTTFFIMGFGYHTVANHGVRPHRGVAWAGFWTAAVGVLLAALPLLSGNASVLFTFYPPMQAHPLFYIGATLLVVGSWVWCVSMLLAVSAWKRAHPDETLPLPLFATGANAVLWQWSSIGVALEVVFQLLPWSLGLVDTVDVGLARTLFSWTLHPIVYFWLIPAYIALYCFVPAAAGGRLFSEALARVSFVLILIFGLPIGFHHLYMDPMQASGWKLAHGVGTYLVAIPTLITAFTVIASLEMAGRKNGGLGLFGWVGKLPWREPVVLAAILSLLMLLLGGFGGLVNASYAMNAMVHNTAWVPGHFHLIFGGTVVTLYFAVAYRLWPSLTGKAFCKPNLLPAQLWGWFIGMAVLTTPWHVLGLLGQPRRVSSNEYGDLSMSGWSCYELMMILGGLILLGSALLFIYNLAAAQCRGDVQPDVKVEYAAATHSENRMPAALNGYALWNALILLLMLACYGYPIAQFFLIETFGSSPWGY